MKRLLRVVRSGLTGVTLALALAGGASCQKPGGTEMWKTYVNVRYRYQICYPADLLRPQGEPDNSDGQEFKASDGGDLAVYGRNNAMGQSLAETVKMDVSDLTGKAGTISYHVTRPGWEVVSGDDGGSFDFYSKTIQRGDQFLIFELKYPKAAATRYRQVVDRLARCFQSTH